MGNFWRDLEFHLAWGFPFIWSVKCAWQDRHGPTPELIAMFRAYKEATAQKGKP